MRLPPKNESWVSAFSELIAFSKLLEMMMEVTIILKGGDWLLLELIAAFEKLTHNQPLLRKFQQSFLAMDQNALLWNREIN